MKILRTGNVSSVAGKIVLGLVVTAIIGSAGMVPAPALARGNDKRVENHDNRRYEDRGRRDNDHRGRYVRDRHGNRHYEYYGHYGYRERVYPPPPVIYAPPPPPPGIRIFFPPIFIGP